MASKTPLYRVQIPAEVLLHIFDCLVPSSIHPTPIALPASDPITKALLSLTLTSREIYPIALRYLYTHCLYIDSLSRLYLVVDSLCLLSNRETDNKNNIASLTHTSPIIPHIKSLYLSLIADNHFPNDPSIFKLTIPHFDASDIANIQQLLSILAPSLQRLLIDISVHSLGGGHPQTVPPTDVLKSACLSLHELEVFCVLRNHAFLPWMEDGQQDVIKAAWPKLRILGVYYVGIVSANRMWQALEEKSCLQTVLVVCRDSSFLRAKERWIPENMFAHRQTKLNAVFVNVSHAYDEFSDVWRLDKNVNVREVQFPIQKGEGRFRKQSLDWIRSRILKGEGCVES